VLVAGTVAAKASRQVGPDEPIVLRGDPPRFVSRGGEKLAGALDRFGVDPAGRRVLDAGASTGGFSDCLLQRGAAAIVAVDVGYGQLHERVRADPRVTVRDRTNVRGMTLDDIGEPVDLVVADLSFISLRLVLPALVGVCAPGAELVVLVKPQFEAGRAEVSRGRGIVTDPDVWREVLRSVTRAAADQGIAVAGLMPSPIRGTEGNVEFLLHGRVATEAGPSADRWDADIEAVVTEAAGAG
jgi:23S rRNA (cytidine1920-2'-O)/16S rRNA (cytidine1409-2'-O)-methyltransferase